jgi:hypothetical protein
MASWFFSAFRVLVIVLLATTWSEAQTLRIDHRPVECAATGRFPRLEARFDPAAAVATARVVFQGQTPDWYSVPMSAGTTSYSGVLPKPTRSLKSFRYYIEATDASFVTNRTAEYVTQVVTSAGACPGKLVAAGVASASVVIHSSAGVAALPAGFSSAGVVGGSATASSGAAAAGASGAAGGGLSGTTIGVAAGAVAAGAVAAVKLTGGTTTNTYVGSFSGRITENVIQPSSAGPGCSRDETYSGTVTVDIDVSSDGTARGDGAMTADSTLLAWIGTCAPNPVGEVQTHGCPFTISGTSTNVLGSGAFTYSNGFHVGCVVAGSVSGDTFAGSLTVTLNGSTGLPSSSTFPLTLSRK